MAASVAAGVAPATRDDRATRALLTRLIALTFVLDATVLASAIPVAVWLKFGFAVWQPDTAQWFSGVPAVDFGWIVPLWLGALAVQDLYSTRHFGRGADEVKALLKGSLTAALVASGLLYLANYDMSRGFYVYAFLVGTALLLAERYVVGRVVARMRCSGRLMHRVVVVGGVAEIAQLERLLNKRPELGYEIVGACVPSGVGAAASPVPIVGAVEEAERACSARGADTLLVAGGSQVSSADLRRIGWGLEGNEVDLIVVPSLLDVAGPRIHSRPVSGLPFLHVEPPQAAASMRWSKALFDKTFALVLLVLLSPVFALIAVAVKLDTGGPVLFRHQRIGVRGLEFGLWKFRSMRSEAALEHDSMVASHGSALLFKARSDPRITRVGVFIRRYSLDELPQLVNVLMGDMSLVGPRPQVAAEVAEYGDHDHRRLLVRPGMTGLWQVSGRSNLTWDEAVRLDLYYVDNWSLMGDLVILFKTVRAVLRHDGAY